MLMYLQTNQKKNPVEYMVKLPWSDNKNVNILTPCKFCSKESLSFTGSKYCFECFKELLSIFVQRKHSVNIHDIIDDFDSYDQ